MSVWEPGLARQADRKEGHEDMHEHAQASLEVFQAWESNPLLPVARKWANLSARRYLHMDGNEGGKKWDKGERTRRGEERAWDADGAGLLTLQ